MISVSPLQATLLKTFGYQVFVNSYLLRTDIQNIGANIWKEISVQLMTEGYRAIIVYVFL